MIETVKELEFYNDVVRLNLKERYPSYRKSLWKTIRKLKQELQDCNTDKNQQQLELNFADDDATFILFYNYSVKENKLTITNILEVKLMSGLKKDIQRIKKDVESIEDIVNNKITEITKTAQIALSDNNSKENKTIKKMGEQFKEDGEQFYIHFDLNKTKRQLICKNIDYLVEKNSMFKAIHLLGLASLLLCNIIILLVFLLDKKSFSPKNIFLFVACLSVSVFLGYELNKTKKKKKYFSKLTIWDRMNKLLNNERYFTNRGIPAIEKFNYIVVYPLTLYLPIIFVTNDLRWFQIYFFTLLSLLIPIFLNITLPDLFKSSLFFIIMGTISLDYWDPIAITLTVLASIFSKDIWTLTNADKEPPSHYDFDIIKKTQRLKLLLTMLPLFFYLFLLTVNDGSFLLNFLQDSYANLELLALSLFPIDSNIFSSSDGNLVFSVFLLYILILILIISGAIILYFTKNDTNKQQKWINVLFIISILLFISCVIYSLYSTQNIIFFKQLIPKNFEDIGKLIRLGVVRTLMLFGFLMFFQSNTQFFPSLITWIEYQVQPISDWLYTPSDKNKK